MSAAFLVAALEQFLAALPDGGSGRILVAFSGGGDSTALLWGLLQLKRPVVAAHLDHGLDPGSAERADAAVRLARRLGVETLAERRPATLVSGQSLEAAARAARYEFLEAARQRAGARWIATGHHREDQAETVVLRCLFGSGLRGLAGIQPRTGRVIRPVLKVPQAVLRDALRGTDLQPVEDPTNRDPRRPRNQVRASLLDRLATEVPCPRPALVEQLSRLAETSSRAYQVVDRQLSDRLGLEALQPRGARVRLAALAELPKALLPSALGLLHRRAGASYPAPRRAQKELGLQLARGARIGCDAGADWQWQARGENLLLLPRVPSPPGTSFSYRLEIPGEALIPELGLWVRLSRRPVEPWMLRGEPHRAGFALPLAERASVTIRNRLPGDRLQALGARGSRRLKEILIDRRVPSSTRDRLPLLCVGGRIAWVPGVTIDERYRLRDETVAWVAELEPSIPEARESAPGSMGFQEG